MTILFLTEFYPRDNQLIFTGGVEARVYYVSRLAKLDFFVEVLTSSSRQIPATPLSIFSRLFYMIKSFYRAWQTEFDLIEASNVVTYLPAWLVARLKRKPAVAWVPDVLGKSWFNFGLIVGLAGLVAEKIYLKLPWTKIIALSNSTRDKLIIAGINETKISVVRAGIDPEEFKFTQPKKFEHFTIICVARLVKTKRIDQLILAVKKLGIRLVIVGFGPEENRLRRLAEELVVFKKNLPRQELLTLVSRCHLFCLPSVVEGFGIATMEAMACGLPAVLADIPVNREITQNGRGAVFFKPESVADLTAKLKLIRRQYRQKQQEALALAKIYTWDKIYRETTAVYAACFH